MARLSVLTPTWNRAEYLERNWQGLLNQNRDDFEWIVVDDGSNDKTAEVMKKIMSSTVLPITYARFSQRVGKCRADNLLLELSKESELVIWCDSDDTLVPDALNKLIQAWDRQGYEKNNFIGCIGLCIDSYGKIQSTNPEFSRELLCTWRQLDLVNGMRNDMCLLINRQKIGLNRFPEHDLVMSESGFWHQFFNDQILYIPYVLKIMSRTADNRISGVRKMEYCRGKAYSIIYANAHDYHDLSRISRLMLSRNFHRYCFHGEISISRRAILFKAKKDFIYHLGLVYGTLLALMDVVRGRVTRTHLIFDEGLSCRPVVTKNY